MSLAYSDATTPTSVAPDAVELTGRMTRLQERMAELDLDWYVVAAPSNVCYFTDFTRDVDERPFLLLVPRTGSPVMLAPALERTHVLDRARLPMDVVSYRDVPAPAGETWPDGLREVLPAQARVGVDGALPVAHFLALPGSPVVADLVSALRFVKTPYELSRIAYACDVLSEAHALGLEQVRPGHANTDVSGAATGYMSGRLLGDNPDLNVLSFSAFMMVWPQSLSADPHNVPSLTAPFTAGGPQVTIAMINAAGYAAELERTFFLETVPHAARDPFDAMMEARATAFSMLRPGVPLHEVDVAARQVLVARGYGPYLLHRTGHGMGLEGHEPPFLAEADERVAEAGMVFSIEPGIYLPGVGGFRHSDTVQVTATGCVSLTRAPETLDELCLR